jgi:uncharacterized protein (TIGR02246 family)
LATPTAIENEVLKLEQQYWDAMKKQDIATMQSLTADPCLVIGGQGASQIPRSQFAQMMQSEDYRLRSFKFDDKTANVRQIGNDVAVVAYKVHEEFERGGRPQQQDAYDTSVWVKKGGRWECAVHTETLATPVR